MELLELWDILPESPIEQKKECSVRKNLEMAEETGQ